MSMGGAVASNRRGPFHWLLQKARALDCWWFPSGSPVTLGVFRILMSGLAFVNLAMISIDFDAWFSERGFVPLRVVRLYLGDAPRLNLLSGVTDDRVTLLFYVGVMAAALLTAMGLWTRLSSALLAIGYVTLHHRNPFILHGGDLVLRVSLIYLAIAPAGAACSLDRVISLWKGRAGAQLPAVPLWVQRLIQYQIALIYVTTVWHKSRGHHWMDGTATWYPLHLNEFDRFWLPEEFFSHPWVLAATTWGTLLVELALGTLVFYRPFRKWVLLSGIALHGFIEWAFNIPLFAFLMVSLYVCFYDGEEVSAWAARLGARLGRFRITVFLPSGCRESSGPVLALRALDPLGLVSYQAGTDKEMKAISAGGGARDPAFGTLVRSLGAWGVPFLPIFWKKLLARVAGEAGAPHDSGSTAAGQRKEARS
jgi:hypothetical protein